MWTSERGGGQRDHRGHRAVVNSGSNEDNMSGVGGVTRREKRQNSQTDLAVSSRGDDTY